MNKKSFFNNDSAVLTCMVQGDNPDRIKELMRTIDSAGRRGIRNTV